MGIDSINPMAQAFFNLPGKKVRTAFHDLKVNILDYYPILSGSITVIFLLSLLAFSILRGTRIEPEYRPLLWLAGGFWVVNFGFSVYASPVALRFQIFPLLIFITTSAIILEQLYTIAFQPTYSTRPDQTSGRFKQFLATTDASS
jgi:hypothetical protein